MGNQLIIFGIILVVIGLAVQFGGRVGLPMLPGDIFIKRENMTFYFPIVTSIVISIILTVIVNLFNRK